MIYKIKKVSATIARIYTYVVLIASSILSMYLFYMVGYNLFSALYGLSALASAAILYVTSRKHMGYREKILSISIYATIEYTIIMALIYMISKSGILDSSYNPSSDYIITSVIYIFVQIYLLVYIII